MRRAKDIEAAAGNSFVDDRLAAEPKAQTQKPRAGEDGGSSSLTTALRICAVLAACYIVGVHELVFAAFVSVTCTPSVVPAGANVTCMVSTGSLSSEAELTITQTGTAGRLVLLSETAQAYLVSFSTRAAGVAGVRLSHSLIFWSSASVEVLPGPAVSVDVLCAPPRVAAGTQVRCAVTPRDQFGNAAEVAKPAGVADDYFGVTQVGGATQLAVHDDHVSFVAGGAGARAGVAVMLDGRRVESTVVVVAPPGAATA
jgi:hypothetical protein